MTETGGPTMQAGAYYQNSVAAIALADLLELGHQPPRERVLGVRVEAPEAVDDVVIRFADGHQLFQNIKRSVETGSDEWKKLWKDLATQLTRPDFRAEDCLAIIFGESNRVADGLIGLTQRAQSSVDEGEWRSRLTKDQNKLLASFEPLLGDTTAIELLRRVEVTVMTQSQVETDFDRRRLGGGFTLPKGFLSILRDVAAGGGRNRASFMATPLRRRLQQEFGFHLSEPTEWGLPAYRAAISQLARIAIPGTNTSGLAKELFVWPRARPYDQGRVADFEDEEPRWREPSGECTVDLQTFPSDSLHRCIIIGGPGFGKSALMWAVADRLTGTPQVPVVIPLASFAVNDLAILDFLSEIINSEMSVRPDWQRLAEQGLLTLLLDGLDEIPSAKRPTVLKRLAQFSARFPHVPWLLSARDPSVVPVATQADLIELTPLEHDDILRFADALQKRLPEFDSRKFLERLRAYPELGRLARIPLFLSMLLAMSGRFETNITTRAELIEAYLKTLFAPHQHKESEGPAGGEFLLRGIAERLAFERLEMQEIGAIDRDVFDAIQRANPDSDAEEVLGRLLANGVLRRQSSTRLQFPFPIVQEYLAACFLVRDRPDSLAGRIEDAIQRPWAQVIQFAIELHASPMPIVRAMLERPDDAFSTGLRLVGRCVANGAHVDNELRSEIETRLVAFWTTASTDAKTKVGNLLTDTLKPPGSPELRAALHDVRLLNYGSGDILAALGDNNLTLSVIRRLIDRGPKEYSFYFDLKQAISAAGDAAFGAVVTHVRTEGLGAEAVHGCSSLLGHFEPGSVSRSTALAIALDESLPADFRMEASRIASAPMDDLLFPLLESILRDISRTNTFHARRALALYPDRSPFLLGLLRDQSLDIKRRLDLAGAVATIFPEPDKRVAFIGQCTDDVSLEPEIRRTIQIFAARYGDKAVFEDLIEQFADMPSDYVGHCIALFGHYPGRDLVARAVDRMRARTWTAHEAAHLINQATTGMFYCLEMDFGFGGVLKAASPHAGIPDFLSLAEQTVARNDLSEIDHLSALISASRLGSETAADHLAQKILLLEPNAPEYAEDHFGYTITSAIREVLRRKGVIPLSVARRYASVSRGNIPTSGFSIIESHANSEALNLLLELHEKGEDHFHRDSLANAIERLAAKLLIPIIATDTGLAIGSNKPNCEAVIE
jgi:NACHT domain